MIVPNTIPDRVHGNERGFALPLALTALVAITVLVTAGILSSATEVTISNAHQVGTTGLYRADGALERYVATKLQASSTSPPTDSLFPVVDDLSVANFAITVQRMRNVERTSASNLVQQFQEYSVLARPTSGTGGRSVGTIVSTERQFQKIVTNIQSGAVVGGALDNKGNSEISAFSQICKEDVTGTALMFTNDVTDAQKKSLDMTRISGDTATYTNVSNAQLIPHLLGGANQAQIFASATIKFGYGGAAPFDESKKPSSGSFPLTSPYNWGCPTQMGITCAGADTLKVPIIAIDARGLTIGLQGDYGQGVLYLRNGHLKITGKFVFKGIIIVDGGAFEVAGTGADGTKIEGSLIATAGVRDSRISGNAVVNYNSCANKAAAAAFNASGLTNAPQTVQQMSGWFEVVR